MSGAGLILGLFYLGAILVFASAWRDWVEAHRFDEPFDWEDEEEWA